ncbi:MAG TPA: PHB depolymerase family esterase [Telluria sp.]|jgi:poly(hydroxyalkanoate) depolymerase family esterase
MKFNERLMAQMRAASNTLKSGQGSKSATAAIQDALKILSPKQPATQTEAAPAMRDINPPPSHARAQAQPQAEAPPQPAPAAARSPMEEVSEVLRNMVPEMMANLDRVGTGGMPAGGFKMPSFELPGGLNGTLSPAPALPGQFIDGSYSNGAGSRDYKLYVPSTYTSAPMPLVVMLHGCTQDPDDFARGTQMNLLAEELRCFVVYPAQSQQANPSRCWNWFNEQDQQRGRGEPSIIAGITETIIKSHNVDSRQVYVAGLSAGGAMATIMGTLYPDLYAAVGVHSGLPFASAHDLPSALAAMKGNLGRTPSSGKPIPIIVFHGDKDTTVHPANGDALIKQGAHKSPKEVVVEPGRVPHGHAYTRTVHHGDDGTAHAEQWLIHGAGHAWSGGSAHGSYTDGKGPDASREMMRFFQTRRA